MLSFPAWIGPWHSKANGPYHPNTQTASRRSGIGQQRQKGVPPAVTPVQSTRMAFNRIRHYHKV